MVAKFDRTAERHSSCLIIFGERINRRAACWRATAVERTSGLFVMRLYTERYPKAWRIAENVLARKWASPARADTLTLRDPRCVCCVD